ncbi:MAG: VCBS repeat-containing protein [Bacteroidia bacterium]
MNKLIFVLPLLFLQACTQTGPSFERLPSSQTGIDFVNEVIEDDSFNIFQDEYMYNGGGVGVADFNLDGLPDLVFTGNKVQSRIYLNLGDFRFQDISAQFEGLNADYWVSGVSIVDINTDAWPDLYFAITSSADSVERQNQLWINQGLDTQGLPTFREAASQYGIADQGYSVHSTFLDYDLDGDLDLYVLNNIVNQNVPTSYRAKLTDGSATNNDQFYRNNGDGSFSNITKEAGIIYEGYGLGIAIGDVNKDDYPDIYISNDYIANDLLYINQGDGTFVNQADTILSYNSKFSMGNDMSDINNDGLADVMTLDMFPEKYPRKKQTINGFSYQFYINDQNYGYQHQYVRNMVHLHNGFTQNEILPYSEVGQLMGVFETEWSWSPLFADYDNDGDRDLLITNGFPKDLTDKDFTNYKAQMGGYLATEKQLLERIPVVKVSNFAYENKGDLKFEDKTQDWGIDIPSFSNGASFVDLDLDGDLDYVVNNINDPAFVYQNNSKPSNENPAHYLRLNLKGAPQNPAAIGAKVEIWSGDLYLYDEHFLSRGYISSIEPILHFGLGAHAMIDSIKIIWPGAKLQSLLKDVSVDQVLTVTIEGATPRTASQNAHPQPTIFSSKTDLIDYLHQEKDYIDFFQSQRIIQHKFSQIGPCLAQGDLNNDGLDDLLIGATDLSPTTAYLQQDGQFVAAEIEGLTDEKVCTESDLLLIDLDGDGDDDLIALAGGYANEKAEEYQHYVYYNDGNHYRKDSLDLPYFPASVVKEIDFDHDGDLDLFIGARVEKNNFPLAGPSYILRNENGRLQADEAMSFELGMVTDAVWSDYDGDGWEDLLISREWNNLVWLKNQAGQAFHEVADKEMANKKGFWSALMAVDLDQDGDDDYILGNLGQNHRFTIDDTYPMRLYAIDIDNNSTLDPITTAYWQDEQGQMQEYPVNYMDELISQSPYFKKYTTSYTTFSKSTARHIFNTDSIPSEQIFMANTAASYVMWNDGGNFRWELLPIALQIAPIKEMLAQDFDGDGHLEVLVAGNDHSYDVATGYYDANKGYLLKVNAQQQLSVLQPAETGILLNGQVESLLYFEGEHSYLVAGINRRKIAVFEQRKSQAQ